jgi:hypothetical protein
VSAASPLAASMAARKEPGPESLLFVTRTVAAMAGTVISATNVTDVTRRAAFSLLISPPRESGFNQELLIRVPTGIRLSRTECG